MKRALCLAALLTAAFVETSCAAERSAAGEAPDLTAPDTEADPAALGALAQSAIPKGECGMVLWTLDENRPAPIFRYLSGKTADIVLDGAPFKLTRIKTAGAGGFGVFESQNFTGDNGISVSVETRFSLGFDGGSYLERGIVTVQTANGWRTVAPAAGLAGCRSK